MGEDGGSARFEMNIFKRLFDLSVKQPRFFNKAGFLFRAGGKNHSSFREM
jgi:hypothetical protein